MAERTGTDVRRSTRADHAASEHGCTGVPHTVELFGVCPSWASGAGDH